MVKTRTLIILGTTILVGGALLFGTKAKAATSSLTIVEGTVAAAMIGAQIVAGGSWVIVAADKSHWDAMRLALDPRAAHPNAVRWVLADMDMLREESQGRGVTIPTSAWGGVAYVNDGELQNYTYFYGSVEEALAQVGKPEGLQSTGLDASFLAAFFP